VAATGVFDSKNVGTGKTVTLTSSYSGADVGNYTITNQPTTTASVTPKALTVSGVTAADKMFDGNTSAVVSGAGARFDGLVAGESILVAAAGQFSDSNPGQAKVVSYDISGASLSNYDTVKTVVKANITPQPSGAVSVLTSSQTGITGTADNNAGTAGVTSTTLLPGSGSVSLAKAPTQTLIVPAPAASPSPIPSEGTLNLASGAQSAQIRLTRTANTVTLVYASVPAGQERPSRTTPALPVFNVNASRPVDESAVVVNASNASISLTGSASAETGLTASAAQDSAAKSAGQMKTTTATLTMPDGSTAAMTVGVTAEGVLVVSVPPESTGPESSKAVSLLAMAAARESLGKGPEDLKGVLIRAQAKP
jgi:hypothetical protein